MFRQRVAFLKEKNKEASNEAYADIKPLLDFYAEKGVPFAQTFLGNMYFRMQRDYKEAAKWYRKAAEQGNAVAQNNLGYVYNVHLDSKEANKEAIKWYLKSAEQGCVYAQFNLGVMHVGVTLGNDGARKYKTGYMWYYLAYLGGSTDAKARLKELEEEGWFSSAKVSKSEVTEAKVEAKRKYDEIRRRNGWE